MSPSSLFAISSGLSSNIQPFVLVPMVTSSPPAAGMYGVRGLSPLWSQVRLGRRPVLHSWIHEVGSQSSTSPLSWTLYFSQT